MKKLADGIWVHRRYWIFKDEQGIYVDFGTDKNLIEIGNILNI